MKRLDVDRQTHCPHSTWDELILHSQRDQWGEHLLGRWVKTLLAVRKLLTSSSSSGKRVLFGAINLFGMSERCWTF